MIINQFDEYSSLAKAMNEATQINDPITHLFAQPRADLAELEVATRAVVAGLKAAGCRDWDRAEASTNIADIYWEKNGTIVANVWLTYDQDSRVVVVCASHYNGGSEDQWTLFDNWKLTDPPPAVLVAVITGGDR